MLTLRTAVGRLRKLYGAPAPPASDPFELILLENVAYLVSPTRRREAFERLRATVGTTPIAILGSREATIADKVRECSRIAVEQFGGNLRAVIRKPLDEAKRALRAFPGIGEPGAEKILLFTGRHALLAPESNGLRVLARLGLIREDRSYSKMYAAANEAAKALPAEVAVLQEAHLLLQQHGQTLCKRAQPRCEECPLATGCAHVLRK